MLLRFYTTFSEKETGRDGFSPPFRANVLTTKRLNVTFFLELNKNNKERRRKR
jgi:hypothetical protein